MAFWAAIGLFHLVLEVSFDNSCLMKLCCTRWLYFLVGAVGHSSVKGKVC